MTVVPVAVAVTKPARTARSLAGSVQSKLRTILHLSRSWHASRQRRPSLFARAVNDSVPTTVPWNLGICVSSCIQFLRLFAPLFHRCCRDSPLTRLREPIRLCHAQPCAVPSTSHSSLFDQFDRAMSHTVRQPALRSKSLNLHLSARPRTGGFVQRPRP